MLLSKKVGRAYHIDRISELSIDVIGIILQRLSHEEVVRTSILSKKWRYMWTLVPQLELMNLKRELYSISSHIFSCEGSTHLKLHNFKVSNVPNFCCFKSLVKLHLSNIRFESNALGSLFAWLCLTCDTHHFIVFWFWVYQCSLFSQNLTCTKWSSYPVNLFGESQEFDWSFTRGWYTRE